MLLNLRTASRLLLLACIISVAAASSFAEKPSKQPEVESTGVTAQTDAADNRPTLAELKANGLQRSRFKSDSDNRPTPKQSGSETKPPQANLAEFNSVIKPLLVQNCIDCHGPDTAEANLRIDTLNPDLLTGEDTDWWSEVLAVISKGEMPPPGDGDLQEEERGRLVDWLAAELQTASIVRRRSEEHSAFRRLTRYEYNYALQDLLGLPWDFAKDLPPEAHSEDGFQNSSDSLSLSVSQFETYYRIARNALRRATVIGDQPSARFWNISMQQAAEREWSKQEEKIEKLKKELKDDPEKLTAEVNRIRESFQKPPGGAYYKQLSTGRTAKAQWAYYGAKYAFAPSDQPRPLTEIGSFPDDNEYVAILPHGRGPRLIVELGNQLPDEGTMRVTVRASRVDTQSKSDPSLQLLFGWQASNEGRALMRVSREDVPVTADPDQPQIIQWDVPLGEIYPRNSVRKTSKMGAMPSPSEYIRLVNSSASPSKVQIDYVQVAAPVYDQWPPESHRRIFGPSVDRTDELVDAREIISSFMRRAWRRPIRTDEVNRKLDRFVAMRPQCETFEEAIIEVLAAVLSSPQFLYVSNTPAASVVNESSEAPTGDRADLDAFALANRLSLFLWCSIPDQELLKLAESGQLADDEVLASQVQRMLDDPRSERFAEHFVHQWLDMQLLDFLNFKQHLGNFDPLLKEAMQHEPVAMFHQMLKDDTSVLDFVHSDFAMVNERLAQHYGLSGVHGNHFRRVSLKEDFRRGGLLTQAGLLAMNSDWPDSHPLKRAIWLLECLLADPPPPPPPAVPQIDLADPEIAKMTLKERIEDHRNHAACLSCHIKIDPWGIAFENYDALGRWRDEINGKPIDATSELFNRQTLDGMDGLKRFLLAHRQDQLVRAIVSKLSTYALGRPLAFSDRAEIDAITARVRHEGDGLRTLVTAIAQSELFRSK